jgi:predicted enzyme related to lactoylglutathione lyase
MPRPVHFELPADNPERMAQFYAEAFGWKVQKWEGPMEYWLVDTGQGPGINGGFYRRTPESTGVVNTLGVENIDAAIAAVETHGGTIDRGKGAIPGVGWFASCRDTEGNPFGLMQDDPSAGQ